MGWLFVVSDEDVLSWILASQRMPFAREAPTRRVKEGDQFVLYATGKVAATAKQGRVFASGTIAANAVRESVRLGRWDVDKVCALTFDKVIPVESAPPLVSLIDRLSFISNKKNWGPALQRPIVTLLGDDFDVLDAALGAVGQ